MVWRGVNSSKFVGSLSIMLDKVNLDKVNEPNSSSYIESTKRLIIKCRNKSNKCQW